MRQRFALLPLLLLLSACGLHPLYGGGSGGKVAGLLSSVQVGPIEGQPGWLVRNKLVDRLGESGEGRPQYRLDVTLDDNLTSLGLRGRPRGDSGAANARARATSWSTSPTAWSCSTKPPAPTPASMSSAPNMRPSPPSRSALENLSGIVADQIVARLAIYAARTTHR